MLACNHRFCFAINTFGFILGLIHIKGCLYYGIMPVDIEQWHAENGDFNACSQLSVGKLYLIVFNCIYA